MDDVDPCELVTKPMLKRLNGSPQPPQPFGKPGDLNEEGAACYYLLRDSTSVVLSAVTNYGFDSWVGDDESDVHGKSVSAIGGYSAARVRYAKDLGGPHSDCRLYVDVSGGQSLQVDVRRNSAKDAPMCETARAFAKAAIESLTS